MKTGIQKAIDECIETFVGATGKTPTILSVPAGALKNIQAFDGYDHKKQTYKGMKVMYEETMPVNEIVLGGGR